MTLRKEFNISRQIVNPKLEIVNIRCAEHILFNLPMKYQVLQVMVRNPYSPKPAVTKKQIPILIM